MAVFTLDLFGAIEKLIEFRKLNEWAKFYTGLVCSFWFSGCAASGAALSVHRPAWEALGEGLIAATVSAAICWHRSELTKGMTLVLPGWIAKKEIESNVSITQ